MRTSKPQNGDISSANYKKIAYLTAVDEAEILQLKSFVASILKRMDDKNASIILRSVCTCALKTRDILRAGIMQASQRHRKHYERKAFFRSAYDAFCCRKFILTFAGLLSCLFNRLLPYAIFPYIYATPVATDSTNVCHVLNYSLLDSAFVYVSLNAVLIALFYLAKLAEVVVLISTELMLIRIWGNSIDFVCKVM